MSDKLKTIALWQLKPSNINVRKTDRHTGIEQLATSIEANGLLENLVVRPAGAGKGKDATYEVIAGGRRLAALKVLAKRKKIARDCPVACLIKAGATDAALEVSLAENFERTDLHPADQFEAFAALVDNGTSVDDVAARFGVTPVFVQQRLKLACVSPRLIAEYRNGAMTLEQLTAFTWNGDHLVQEQVWFDRPYADLPADMIRRFLTKTQVEGGDRRARFIGTRAYEAAGGTITRDLFDLNGDGYFTDSQLLDRLVADRLEAAAQELRAEGWQWVEVHQDHDYGRLSRFGRADPIEVSLTKTQDRRLAKLSKRYDKLVVELEEADSDSVELNRVSAEMASLIAKKESWSDAVKAESGAIVSLGHDGTLKIVRGLIQPAPSKATGKNGKDTDSRNSRRCNGYADSVLVELSAERTAALQEAMAGKPEIALITLLHTLVCQLFQPGISKACLDIIATPVSLDRFPEVVTTSKAAQAFRARLKSWYERLPQHEELWDWLTQLRNTERLELLAVCVASTINALSGPRGQDVKPGDADLLVRAVDLDMTAWWRVTQRFLLGLSKVEIIAAVENGVSAADAKRLGGLKKERMAAKAEALLAKSSWLPVPLRSTPTER